ncbi:NAD(P)/FAD-dependent oxidoreductase [Streptomyces fuscigenes]|uniref:NAD(P)/FAD-dependent oxidoreductase n=1 Tax=Streptomyces fuscigenes TaxID=1528880 RepID=UPI001F3D1D33|nr:NAD(P)/FAD-dependent oxidoreductase [Streptomyces fuscigenes]MCF3961823.1 NAD(P)/FAD-dependent oxidoreductase [Streptomyces fuscigenes]
MATSHTATAAGTSTGAGAGTGTGTGTATGDDIRPLSRTTRAAQDVRPTRAEVAVVGGGIAGVQAALVLARSRRSVVVVDSGHPRNENASAVHNLAGHEGVDPSELLARARADAARYGVAFVSGTVVRARAAGGRPASDAAGRPDWQITVAPGAGTTADAPAAALESSGTRSALGPRGTGPQTHRTSGTGDGVGTGTALAAGTLVLATGIAEDLPDVPGLAALWGTDVVSCPYCHGWEATGLPVAVVGSGPRAWRQLLLLSRFTDDLTLAADGPAGLDPAQLDRLARLGVKVTEDRVRRVVAEAGRLVGIEFAGGGLVPYGALFAATARRQASSLPGLLGCDVSGAAVTTDADGRTSVPGVWAAGTCADPALTVAGAAGHATATAIALNNALLDAETAAPAGA